MVHGLKILAIATNLLLAAQANGEDAFDPKGYIQTKDGGAVEPLREGEVSIKGIHYRVFKSPSGNLYVPATENVGNSEIEAGLCANQIPLPLEKCSPDDAACRKRNSELITDEVTVVRADTPIGAHTKLYAEILTRTIRRKCGDVAPAYFVPVVWKPEIGVEYKDEPKRDPTTYKFYIDPALRPSFKADF